MPISYVALSTYARDHGIAGKDFGDFLRTMNKLDSVFLQVEAEREKASKERGAPA
jgi:hypothetical protein